MMRCATTAGLALVSVYYGCINVPLKAQLCNSKRIPLQVVLQQWLPVIPDLCRWDIQMAKNQFSRSQCFLHAGKGFILPCLPFCLEARTGSISSPRQLDW